MASKSKSKSKSESKGSASQSREFVVRAWFVDERPEKPDNWKSGDKVPDGGFRNVSGRTKSGQDMPVRDADPLTALRRATEMMDKLPAEARLKIARIQIETVDDDESEVNPFNPKAADDSDDSNDSGA